MNDYFRQNQQSNNGNNGGGNNSNLQEGGGGHSGGGALGARVPSMANRSGNELMGNQSHLMQRAISQVDSRSGFGNDSQGIRQTANRIHYFKFD